ncbi:MAG: PTS sugar transporter subunit IIA [Proteocatella sp.]
MPNISIDKNVVTTGLEVETKEEAIEILAKMLEINGYVKEGYCKAVLERERVFPTGLLTEIYGVAIPHADITYVNESMIAVAVLKEPVEFNMLGYSSQTVAVKLILMLAMKDGHSQLTLLRNLMNLIQNEEAMAFIIEATEMKQIADFLNSKLYEAE